MSSSSPCAACKFLRRKCTQECIFSPYFPQNEPHRFANIHKVFGASNVAKILQELKPDVRKDAADSLVFEAESRLYDPVYGCVGDIYVLQQRLKQIRIGTTRLREEIAVFDFELSYPKLAPLYRSNNASFSSTVPYVGPSYGGSYELQKQMAEVEFMGQQQGVELQRQMAEEMAVMGAPDNSFNQQFEQPQEMVELEFMRQQQGLELQRQTAEEGLVRRQQECMFFGLGNRQFDLSGQVSGGHGFEPATVAVPLQPAVMGASCNLFNQQIEQPLETAEVEFMRQQQRLELQRQMAEEGTVIQPQEYTFADLGNRQFDLSSLVSDGHGFEPVTLAVLLQPAVMGASDNSFNQRIEQPLEMAEVEFMRQQQGLELPRQMAEEMVMMGASDNSFNQQIEQPLEMAEVEFMRNQEWLELQRQMAEEGPVTRQQEHMFDGLVECMRQQQGIELPRQMAEEGLVKRQQEHMFVCLGHRQFDLSGLVSDGNGFEPVPVAVPWQTAVMGPFDNSCNQQTEQPREHNKYRDSTTATSTDTTADTISAATNTTSRAAAILI